MMDKTHKVVIHMKDGSVQGVQVSPSLKDDVRVVVIDHDPDTENGERWNVVEFERAKDFPWTWPQSTPL